MKIIVITFIITLLIAIFYGSRLLHDPSNLKYVTVTRDPGDDSVESDEAMIQRFYNKKKSLDLYISIIKKHGKSGIICSTTTPRYEPFQGPDLEICRNCLKDLGSNLSSEIWCDDNGVTADITMWHGHAFKGYYYTTKNLLGICSSLDELVKQTTSETKYADTPARFRHITGPWYLSYWCY